MKKSMKETYFICLDNNIDGDVIEMEIEEDNEFITVTDRTIYTNEDASSWNEDVFVGSKFEIEFILLTYLKNRYYPEGHWFESQQYQHIFAESEEEAKKWQAEHLKDYGKEDENHKILPGQIWLY